MDIPYFWRKKALLSYLLFPISLIFALIIWIRRFLYQKKILKSYRPPVFVLIVGNITVGGNGKTPTVIALYRALSPFFKIGIISRGYGGTNQQEALLIAENHSAHLIGDEVKLMAQQTRAPIAIAKKRFLAVELLLKHYPDLEMIIADDGLQHYALARDFELITIAPDFQLGNGFLLPAGALREPQKRLHQADYILETQPQSFRLFPLNAPEKALFWDDFKDFKVKALTAIARPERFFNTLKKHLDLGEFQSYPDHSHFTAEMLKFAQNDYLFITSKDAVKIQELNINLEKIIVVDYEIFIPPQLIKTIKEKHARFITRNPSSKTQ